MKLHQWQSHIESFIAKEAGEGSQDAPHRRYDVFVSSETIPCCHAQKPCCPPTPECARQ